MIPEFVTSASSSPANFAPPQQLSTTIASSQAIEPVVASAGSHVYVAWLDNSNQSKATYRVLFRASSDNGTTFSPVYVASCPQTKQTCKAAAQKTALVFIAAVGNYVYLVWNSGNTTMFNVSSNNGSTFGTPTNVILPLSQCSGDFGFKGTSSPQLAAVANDVYVSWVETLASGEQHIYFASSINHGLNFTCPVLMSGGQTHAKEDQLAAAGSNVYLTWDSIYVSTSNANGSVGSWSKSPLQLSKNCCQGGLNREPWVLASGNDVYVSWTYQNSTSGNYNAVVAVNNNQGKGGLSTNPLTGWKVVNLTPGFKTAREVEVSTSGNNVAVTYFGSNSSATNINQWISTSTDSGNTFGKPIDLAYQPGNEPGFGGVLVDGSNIYAFWPHNLKGTSYMFFQMSQDAGATWAYTNATGFNAGVQISNAQSIGMQSECSGSSTCDAGPMIADSMFSSTHSLIFLVWQQEDSSHNNQTYFDAGSF